MDVGPDLDQFEALLEFLPVSEHSPCSYFSDRVSRYRAFRFDGTLAESAHELVMDRGYRRCGGIYYVVSCPGCRACTPFRLDVDEFEPSKSQRRALSRNRDLRFEVGDPVLTDEKRALYLAYSCHQHPEDPAGGAPGALRSEEELLETLEIQLYSNPDTTREFQLLDADNRLYGYGIMDVAEETVSAVYNVYDPTVPRRSLGTYAILKSLEWTRNQGMRYLNLGYYIANHPKMNYKGRFKPAEEMDWESGQWRAFSEPEA